MIWPLDEGLNMFMIPAFGATDCKISVLKLRSNVSSLILVVGLR